MEQEYKKLLSMHLLLWLSLESAATCLKLYFSLKTYLLSVDENVNQRFDRLFG